MPKKNFRKLPDGILAKIARIDVDDIVVACVEVLEPSDFPRYAHLQLRLESGRLIIPPAAPPPARVGRYSYANVYGKDVVRKDLPMIPRSFSWDSPHFGDWTKGSYTHSRTRQVYERTFYPPKEVPLRIECLAQESDGSRFTLKFSVDQVLRRNAADFEKELLYNLNILQENVTAVNVFPSTATLADYVNTIHLQWQILPPGNIDETVRHMLAGRRVSPEQLRVMVERLTAMEHLNPDHYIAGSDSFLRYFGARFADDLVAFENVTYGNALYVMFEDWATLARRTRIDLLAGPRDGFERIPHHGGWIHRLGTLVRQRRERQAPRQA